MNILRPILLAVASLFVLAHTAQAHYDPNIGRWLSRDPIGEEAFLSQLKTEQIQVDEDPLDAESLKPPYLAFRNSPISFIDPNGLVVVGIYGFGPADKLFGAPMANRQITQIADTAGGKAFGRSQDGSIRSYLREGIQKNPDEPIVLFGYSRGAIKTVEIAEWILDNKKDFLCPSIYIVGIDPVTITGPGPVKIPDGVKEWKNWCQHNGGGFGPFKVMTFNFANLDGTTYSGGNGSNEDFSSHTLKVWNRRKQEYEMVPVNHANMPRELHEKVLQQVLDFKNR